jgi:peptidoglycan/LPS O-acetylase OafA/YrhL
LRSAREEKDWMTERPGPPSDVAPPPHGVAAGGERPVAARESTRDEPPIEGETTGRELAVRTIGFVPAFDGLRGVAVLLIVVIHVTGSFIPDMRAHFLPGGFLGVDIFFVLSGFLITSILLREFERTARIRLGRFYLGRVLRLLPALAVFLVVQAWWATSIGVPGNREWPAVFQGLTYLSNWRVPFLEVPGGILGLPPALGQLWSLAVEEQFYLVWPLIILGCLVVFRRRVVTLWITAGLIVLIALHRAVDFGPGSIWLTLYARTDYRADTLLIGALAAQLWVGGWLPSKRVLRVAAWIGVGVVGIGVAFAQDTGSALYLGGYTVVGVAVAAVLLAIVDTDWSGSRLLSVRPLCVIGMVSYGFYIWHPLAFAIIGYYGTAWSTWAKVGMGLALASAMTTLSWYLVERPFLLLKDRLRAGSGRSLTNSRAGLPNSI